MTFGFIARQWKLVSTLYYCELAFRAHSQRSKKVTTSFIISVCLSAQNISAPTGFMKFDIWVFFWKSAKNIKDSLKSDKKNGDPTWIPIYIYDHILLNSS